MATTTASGSKQQQQATGEGASAAVTSSTSPPEDNPVQNAINMCEMIEYMINNNAKRLDGLRTQCSVTEEITQKEIRELEVKILL